MASTQISEAQRLDWIHTQLRESVRRLAWSPPQQIAWLKEIKTYPLADELALEFDHYFELAPQLVEAGQLSPDAMDALKQVDCVLEALTNGGEELWSPRALESNGMWAEVRVLADRALNRLP